MRLPGKYPCLNGPFYIQNSVSIAGNAAHVAHSGKSSAQCLFRAARDCQGFGFLTLGVYFLPHRMPVKIIHMHVGINHSRSHLTVTEINDIRTFRHGNFTVNFRNEMIFYQNTLAALPFLRYAVIKTPAPQNLVFFIHTV